MKTKHLLVLIGLLLLVGIASAGNSNVVVAGAIIMKGASGVLVPLGIELFVDGAATTYLYNLLSVAIIMFIAAMSGARSEAAFCIVVPIFAGIMEMFGWMRLSTVAATNGLIALTVVMGVFGVFMYMNDQNKQNYGTLGPGSKLFNIAFFIMMFVPAITLISGFSIFPMGSTQPLAGTCAVGLTCDAYGNIDFSSSVGSISHSGGLLQSAISASVGILAASLAAVLLILNILLGILWFPLVLDTMLNGIFPGITSNGAYQAFRVVALLVVWASYALCFYEIFWKPSGGSQTI